ncbi:MAG: cyclic nucleotide-binding domain-containing protein [Proteobacteria bacterium]|nr:cyclic nucleotide-binding domain-containing protein [Pseudomonadota bacterium]
MSDSFWSNIFKNSGKGVFVAREALKATPIFGKLKRSEIIAVERILHLRQYASGETIFSQGEPGIGMYVIVDGRVDILFEGSGQTIANLEEGDFFGEIALLTESPRTATARASENSKLMFFSQADLYNLINIKPKLGSVILMRLGKIIAKRLISSNDELQSLRNEQTYLKEDS